jgi:hypothetical protein
MIRAARLDSELYEEVEAEHRSLPQALVVVLLAAAAGGAASVISGRALERILVDVLEPLTLWIVGSVFTYMVGATFLRGPETSTDYAEVLRTTGFAFTPGLLRLGGALPWPPLAAGLTYLADAWMLVAGIVSVRQALDFTTWRAIATFGVSYALLWLTFEGFLFSLPL